MKLAIETRYQDREVALPLERIRLAERAGYDAVFVPEGHGADCFAQLGFIAAHTTRLVLGTRIMQITARSPASAAMSFQTLEQLAGRGRVIAGIGSSMRQTCEGWHGRPWGSPMARMRDYVAIMRAAVAADGAPVDYRGAELSVPYAGPDALPATPMRSYLDCNPAIPIVAAASSPAMIRLQAEIADGWFPSTFWPGDMGHFRPIIEEGLARANARSGGGKTMADFQIWNHVDVLPGDDVRTAMQPAKVYVATWAGMNATTMEARGYGAVRTRILELQAAGRDAEAIACVPDEYVDAGWLVGPMARVMERARGWRDSGVTGTIIRHGDQFAPHAPAENLEIYAAIARAMGK